MHPATQQPVHEQFPCRNVLNLVKVKDIEGAVNDERGLENVIQVAGGNALQCLVIEVDVAKAFPAALHGKSAENGFPTSPYACDNLGHGTFDIDSGGWCSVDDVRLGHHPLDFQFLLRQYLFVVTHLSISSRIIIPKFSL